MIRGLLLILLLFVASCSTPEKTKPRPYTSVVYTEYGSAGYKPDVTKAYMTFLKTVGANTMSVLMTCMTKDKTSSAIDCDSYDSPKQKDIAKILKGAKSKGFKTSLRVYVDLKSGDWRALWDPTDKAEAFSQLEKTLTRFAKFSQKKGVDVFILGAELEKLTRPRYRTSWQKIIKKVRSVYKGKITYGANGNFSSYKTPEYQWVPFWDQLDFLGVDHYAPFPKEKTLTRDNLQTHHCSSIDKYQSVAPAKPIYFVEVGFPAAEQGHLKPYEWRWKKETRLDLERQGQNIRAFLHCFWVKGARGVTVWRYMSDSKNRHHGGYHLDHTEARSSLKSGFLPR